MRNASISTKDALKNEVTDREYVYDAPFTLARIFNSQCKWADDFIWLDTPNRVSIVPFQINQRHHLSFLKPLTSNIH